VAILTEMMDFTEQEDAKFWPITASMTGALEDQRRARHPDPGYAKNYEQMTDAVADRIAIGALGLEGRRQR
jgi:hypothetical protein